MTTEKGKLRRDIESVRDDLQRMAGEIRLQLHLGGMEAKDKWAELEPKLIRFEEEVETAADDVSDEVSRVATVLVDEFKGLSERLRQRV